MLDYVSNTTSELTEGKVLMSQITLPSSRPNCTTCGKPAARMNHQGKIYWRKYCHSCADKNYKDPEKKRENDRKASRKYHQKFLETKLNPCVICGFTPKDGCQMDWDHINGIHFDDRPENRQLLCANCHRLKSKKNGDYSSPAFLC